MPNLSPSHLDSNGRAQMVDIGKKMETRRQAVSVGEIRISRRAIRLIRQNKIPKGNVLAAARIAGILAAKKTGDWIPLCHPLSLDSAEIRFRLEEEKILIRSNVRTQSRTGAEMEALTSVSAAALTLYDMCKAVDKAMVIGPIALIQKSGGRSGSYLNETVPAEYLDENYFNE